MSPRGHTKGWSRSRPRLPSSAVAELGFNLKSVRRQVLSISHNYMQLNLCTETSSLTPATGHSPPAPVAMFCVSVGLGDGGLESVSQQVILATQSSPRSLCILSIVFILLSQLPGAMWWDDSLALLLMGERILEHLGWA